MEKAVLIILIAGMVISTLAFYACFVLITLRMHHYIHADEPPGLRLRWRKKVHTIRARRFLRKPENRPLLRRGMVAGLSAAGFFATQSIWSGLFDVNALP